MDGLQLRVPVKTSEPDLQHKNDTLLDNFLKRDKADLHRNVTFKLVKLENYCT
jgi:hypothetical protein